MIDLGFASKLSKGIFADEMILLKLESSRKLLYFLTSDVLATGSDKLVSSWMQLNDEAFRVMSSAFSLASSSSIS